MLFLVTPVLFVGEPILILCQIRHVVVGLFLTIIYSVIFLKTQKLLFIFRCKLRVSQREKQVSTVTDLFYLLLFLSAQTITATFTLSQTPAKVVKSIDKKSMIRNVYCNTGGHLNLQLLCCVIIMLIVVIQGLRAWRLPSFFNDTKFISLANLLSVWMSACVFPLYYSVTSPVTRIFMQAMLVLCCNVTLLIAMYGNKIYTVWFRPEKNTSVAFRAKMQEHAKDKANILVSERSGSENTSRKHTSDA